MSDSLITNIEKMLLAYVNIICPLLISLYNIAVLIIICRFLINVVVKTLVEIGPSNASQGQHRRKDATEQINKI